MESPAGASMKLKDLLYDALPLTYPEMKAKFPAYAKTTFYQALSSLKAEGRARSEVIPRSRQRKVDRNRCPRTRWVRA